MEAVESLIIFRITRLKKHSSNHWPDWGGGPGYRNRGSGQREWRQRQSDRRGAPWRTAAFTGTTSRMRLAMGLCPFQEPEMVSGLYRVVLPSGSEEVTVSHKLRNLGKGVE